MKVATGMGNYSGEGEVAWCDEVEKPSTIPLDPLFLASLGYCFVKSGWCMSPALLKCSCMDHNLAAHRLASALLAAVGAAVHEAYPLIGGLLVGVGLAEEVGQRVELDLETASLSGAVFPRRSWSLLPDSQALHGI